MSTHHEEIEKDQYDKINTLAAKVEGLTSAVDGRLSPVIVTDWNWKALKSSR